MAKSKDLPVFGSWAGMVGSVASWATISRKSFVRTGLDCRKAGTWAQAQSGRVVVDSQSIMHV